MSLEDELQRVLQSKSAIDTGEPPIDALHKGMRRRRRRQQLAASSTSLSVIAIAVLGLLVAVHRTPRPPDLPPPTTSIARFTVSSAVPAGFQISDLTFLSTTSGYALGTTPCYTAGRCTALLSTQTGGRSWSREAAPYQARVVDPDQPLPASCATGTCVSHLRWTVAGVGYAYGPDLMTISPNGTWTKVPTSAPVEALEAAGRSVIRVLAVPGGGHVVQRATVGHDDWKQVLDVPAKTFHALLQRQGDRLVLVTYDNNATEPDVSDIRTSTDGGTTWTQGQHLPCDTKATTDSVALGRHQQVLVLCTRRDGSGSYVRRSMDNGAAFDPPADLPRGYTALEISAPSNGGWLVSANKSGSAVRAILTTSDRGLTWTIATSDMAGSAPVTGGYLDISSSSIVTWVGPNARNLWRSTDAGRSWVVSTFR